MDYKALQKQCYLEVEQVLSEADLLDDESKKWFDNYALLLNSDYYDPIDLISAKKEKMHPGRFSHIKHVLQIGDIVNQYTGAMIPRIPFATRMLNPTMFYDDNPEVMALCEALLCPVSFAEGREVIGIITINPVAAQIMKKELIKHVQEQYRITPYVTLSMSSNRGGWAQVCDKHFKTNLTSEIL